MNEQEKEINLLQGFHLSTIISKTKYEPWSFLSECHYRPVTCQYQVHGCTATFAIKVQCRRQPWHEKNPMILLIFTPGSVHSASSLHFLYAMATFHNFTK